jgi:hypothetical protein
MFLYSVNDKVMVINKEREEFGMVGEIKRAANVLCIEYAIDFPNGVSGWFKQEELELMYTLEELEEVVKEEVEDFESLEQMVEEEFKEEEQGDEE